MLADAREVAIKACAGHGLASRFGAHSMGRTPGQAR